MWENIYATLKSTTATAQNFRGAQDLLARDKMLYPLNPSSELTYAISDLIGPPPPIPPTAHPSQRLSADGLNNSRVVGAFRFSRVSFLMRHVHLGIPDARFTPGDLNSGSFCVSFSGGYPFSDELGYALCVVCRLFSAETVFVIKRSERPATGSYQGVIQTIFRTRVSNFPCKGFRPLLI